MAKSPQGGAHIGMPDPHTILAADTLVPGQKPGSAMMAAAAKRPAYPILITNQLDPYEKPLSKAKIAGVAPLAAAGDDFTGTDRKAAKLSISKAKTESFADLKDLIATLVADKKMIAHKPKITKDANSGRVEEEERNVRVK